MELEYAISSSHVDNTSEPATVLFMNQSLDGLGIVDALAMWCPILDVCEPATTIDSVWTTMCDLRCSLHHSLDEQILPPWLEFDVYQFDAMHFAWTIGRLGLHSRFIVAPAGNGTTSLEDFSLVEMGFTFEFLLLPHLCVFPRPELADPDFIEAMRVAAFRWKRYQKLKADLYNPRTQNQCYHCLFMCAAYILRQHGIVMSQQQ
eukprot:3557213-Amphidinium_carterae.1